MQNAVIADKPAQLAEKVRAIKEKFAVSTGELAKLLGLTKTTISRWERNKTKTSLAALSILALERLEQLIECHDVARLSGACQKRAVYEVRIPMLGIKTRVCQICCDDILEGATVDEVLLVDGKEVAIWVSAALHRIEVIKLCNS
jgi:DNA-binding XRE family transcriptional regulator